MSGQLLCQHLIEQHYFFNQKKTQPNDIDTILFLKEKNKTKNKRRERERKREKERKPGNPSSSKKTTKFDSKRRRNRWFFPCKVGNMNSCSCFNKKMSCIVCFVQLFFFFLVINLDL